MYWQYKRKKIPQYIAKIIGKCSELISADKQFLQWKLAYLARQDGDIIAVQLQHSQQPEVCDFGRKPTNLVLVAIQNLVAFTTIHNN